jgi:hypothetical protein
MTYRSSGGRQFIIIATGGGEDASLVGFAIPSKTDAGPPEGGHYRTAFGTTDR